MHSITQVFKRYGLASLLFVVILAFCYVFHLYWHHPEQLQAAGVVASFAIAAVLTAITWQYAYTTGQSLELLRVQWKAQQEIHIRFGVKIQDGRARVWVRNLGISNFMVTKAIIENDDGHSKTLYKHMIVQPERRSGFFIPDVLWERHNIFCDLNITLFYESAAQPEISLSKAYNVLLGVSGRSKIIHVYRGIRSWYVHCPKCKSSGEEFNKLIDTRGLANFAQAREREKQAEKEFEASHPEHQSQWDATIESVREHNRTEETESE